MSNEEEEYALTARLQRMRDRIDPPFRLFHPEDIARAFGIPSSMVDYQNRPSRVRDLLPIIPTSAEVQRITFVKEEMAARMAEIAKEFSITLNGEDV